VLVSAHKIAATAALISRAAKGGVMAERSAFGNNTRGARPLDCGREKGLAGSYLWLAAGVAAVLPQCGKAEV
jgi:hypothetical protein